MVSTETVKHGTGIEWTHVPGYKGETWNVLAGCTPRSEGCRNCYAAELASTRLKHTPKYRGLAKRVDGRGVFTGEVRVWESAFNLPLRQTKPRAYFVNSMSDIFHEAVPDSVLDRIFATAALCPQHLFIMLTKCPERMAKYLSLKSREALIGQVIYRMPRPASEVISEWGGLPLPNVWLGVSVEDQATADERIPHLLETPAAVRFVSYEPALGPVDFNAISHRCLWPADIPGDDEVRVSVLSGFRGDGMDHCRLPPLDWIIGGSESGPRARESEIDWFRKVKDGCVAAGVPFFFKQFLEGGKKISTPILDGRKWTEFPSIGRLQSE